MKNPFEGYAKYLNDNPKGYWFKRKMYGWGWVPATWQGRLVTLVYILLILLTASSVDKNANPNNVGFNLFLPVIVFTVIFFYICYKKGEKLGWQWGRRKDDK